MNSRIGCFFVIILYILLHFNTFSYFVWKFCYGTILKHLCLFFPYLSSPMLSVLLPHTFISSPSLSPLPICFSPLHSSSLGGVPPHLLAFPVPFLSILMVLWRVAAFLDFPAAFHPLQLSLQIVGARSLIQPVPVPPPSPGLPSPCLSSLQLVALLCPATPIQDSVMFWASPSLLLSVPGGCCTVALSSYPLPFFSLNFLLPPLPVPTT